MPVSDILTALRSGTPVLAAELRPPRAELAAREGMDAWIDTYHAVRGLTRQGTYVFLTDSAVGAEEEDNLRHLVTNLGTDVPRQRIVPFLTSKHSLQFCLSYAERARQSGFPALVVLGGDKMVGPPRSVEHAWQLRALLRSHDHKLALGGWANPHGDAERQVDYLAASDFHAEFYLTQIVSHHEVASVGRKTRSDAAGSLRCVLLPKRESENAADAPQFPPSASRGPVSRICVRRRTGRRVRQDDTRPARGRREAFLHQQSADRPCANCPENDPAKGRLSFAAELAEIAEAFRLSEKSTLRVLRTLRLSSPT